MSLRSLPTRNLVAYAAPEAFADNTCVILDLLGCHILTPEEFAEENGAGEGPAKLPDLYLVEELQLPSLPDAKAAPVPVLILSPDGVRKTDERIVGVIRTPVGMHELYRVVQQILEQNPRSTPRVATKLEALCRSKGEQWSGSVLSLSENGCLLRSQEPLRLGSEVRVSFELPEIGKLHVTAEAAYELKSDMGLVFSSTSPQIREALRDFVTRRLLDANPATPLSTR